MRRGIVHQQQRVHLEPSCEEMADAGARLPLAKRSRTEPTTNATKALRQHLAGETQSTNQQHHNNANMQRHHDRYNHVADSGNNVRMHASVFHVDDEYRESRGGGFRAAAAKPTTRVNQQEEEQKSGRDDDEPMTRSLLQNLPSGRSSASYFTWRLPAHQDLDASEQYLNEQLMHIPGSVAVEFNAQARRTGQQQEGNEDALCQLSLHKHVWSFIRRQTAFSAASKEKLQLEKDQAEQSIRDAMDLISLLLYLRQRELERQNEASERQQQLEKELQRRKNTIQALATELETAKQHMAQQENYFRAKELAFTNERKTWQTERKSLEVLVARLQGIETAFKAQLRRKDAEYERLRKNLQDSVARTSKEQCGITVGKLLNGVTERKRTVLQSQSRENQLSKQIMENMERKKAELLFENEALVNNYEGLQRQLELLTSQYRMAAQLFLAKKGPDGVSEELLALTSVPIDDFMPTAFAMPSKQQLPHYIAMSMDVLHGKLGQFEVAMRADLEQDAIDDRDEAIAILQKKLTEAQEIITEQDHLLQASLVNEPVGVALAASASTREKPHKMQDSDSNHRVERRFSFGSDDDVITPLARSPTSRLPPHTFQVAMLEELEERAEALERQKCDVALQQKHIEQERQLLQDQAMQLDQDRLTFETPAKKKRSAYLADLDVQMDSPSIRIPVPAHEANERHCDGFGAHFARSSALFLALRLDPRETHAPPSPLCTRARSAYTSVCAFPMADDALVVRYGHKIRLGAASAYLASNGVNGADNASAILGIGYYEKNGRHGILSCVPPLGDKLDHLFNEDEYLVLDPSEQHEVGDVVEYGHVVVLVNQHGMVWNNKTGGITGYVGPRPRNIPGEMFVTFQKMTSGNGSSSAAVAAVVPGSSKSDSSKTASAPAVLSSQSSSASTSSASSHVTSVSSSASSTALVHGQQVPLVSQGPLRYGDRNVAIKVAESNRHSVMFNKRLSNFKKPTSRIAGGYICCDGKGSDLKFTVCPANPRVEQISMLNKLITSYNYGQKIALPLALLETCADKVKIGGIQQAEIVFKLSNQATAVLPGKLLHEKLMAHAVVDANAASKQEKESIFVLPLRNGPGELVLKLIGSAPQKAIGKIAGENASSTSSSSDTSLPAISGTAMLQQLSLFYKFVDVLRMVPVPVFALLYAILTHFLWNSLMTMEDGLKRELVVLVLVAFPAFYVAVKVDHPFSSLLQPPPVEPLRESEPVPNANLKLIVTEYRFNLSATGAAPVSAVAIANGVDLRSPGPTAVVAAAVTTDASSSTTTATALVVTAVPRRFVLAEKGDEVKALARYQETLAWRREENLSEILFKPSPAFKTIKENYPHYYHKRGKRGEPVYYEKPGKINLKALKSAGLNLDDLMHNYIMVTEFLWQVIEADDNKKCISVVDVEGIGISDFRGEAVEYVKKAAAVSGKHYPERCAYIFVINIPSWFNVIWNVVKGMIDEVTREKVVMVRGKKNILEALLERIPLENIPEEYGGTSEGSSSEEIMLHDLMAYLNKDADAPATNPVEHLLKKSTAAQ
ncbi:Phosphatidylinositol transfer protein, partial [Globisporangium splendens]